MAENSPLSHTESTSAAGPAGGAQRSDAEASFGEQAVAERARRMSLGDASGEVIVGLDGSEQSYGALAWAVAEAQRRKAPVRLVTAYSLPVFTGTGFDAGYSVIDENALTQGVAQILDEARRRVGDSPVELRATVETGDASAILVELSEKAELIVVGSRSARGFMGRLLGTVSTSLPARSHCPVVVVPLNYSKEIGEGRIPEPQHGVAVGSDGSDQARVAILAAAEQADRMGVGLKLVNALAPYTGALTWVPAAVDFEAMYREIEALQERAISWIKGYYPQLEVTAELVDGSPVEVLLEAGQEADLVVVGTRGRGGLRGMILGSVSQGVLHGSDRPVMIVPELHDPRIDEAPEASVVWG